MPSQLQQLEKRKTFSLLIRRSEIVLYSNDRHDGGGTKTSVVTCERGCCVVLGNEVAFCGSCGVSQQPPITGMHILHRTRRPTTIPLFWTLEHESIVRWGSLAFYLGSFTVETFNLKDRTPRIFASSVQSLLGRLRMTAT